MIQKNKQVEYRIAMIGWARLSLSFFFTLDVLSATGRQPIVDRKFGW